VKGKLLPAKQPGVFLATAIADAPLRVLGITYEKHRDFVSAWTSWWTSALAMAVCVVLFFHFARKLGARRIEAGAASLILAFGSSLFPYTGTPHHDVLATVFLFVSVILLLRLDRLSTHGRIFFSGIWLGWVLFFSMLPALLVAVTLGFAWMHLGFRRVIPYWGGFLAGSAPLALYNTWYFGAPWVQANMAGAYTNTFFSPSRDLFFTRWNEYFGPLSNMSVTLTMPVFLLGMIGILFTSRSLASVRSLVCAFILIHCVYLFGMGTEGHCQFGPRYFMPLLPFIALGLTQWFQNRIQLAFLMLTGLVSIGIHLAGALGSTMVCTNLVEHPLKKFLSQPESTLFVERPLVPLLTLLTLVLAWSVVRARNQVN
jgi:hypothetical protein